MALTGDYTPQRLRAMMIMLTFTGAPLGGFVGGLVVSLLLHEGFGWPIIFVIGGVFPLVLLAITALWLPESPRLLAARANLAPHHHALLQRLAIAPSPEQAHAIDVARGNPIRLLFGEGYALQTILLWIIFFCSLLDLFLFVFWLPEVLHLIGMTPAQAVFATSLYPLGGMLAVLYLGWAIDRFGAHRALAVHFAVGIVFICADRAGRDALFRAAGRGAAGRDDGARQPDRLERGLRQALSGPHARQRLRVRDRRRATGRHRRGTARRVSAGSLGLPPPYVFLSACVFAAIAAVATALLALPARQPSAASRRDRSGVASVFISAHSSPGGVPTMEYRDEASGRRIRMIRLRHRTARA